VRDLNGTKIRPLSLVTVRTLTSWLIKPFQDRVKIPREERKFNTKLSALRSVVERAVWSVEKTMENCDEKD